jgi:hypothetical protein
MVANQRNDFQQIEKSEGIFELRMRVKAKCTFAEKLIRCYAFRSMDTISLFDLEMNG